jgi:hypothetical protein
MKTPIFHKPAPPITGARCEIKIDGKVVAYASNVEYKMGTPLEPIRVLNYAEEVCPMDYDSIELTCTMVCVTPLSFILFDIDIDDLLYVDTDETVCECGKEKFGFARHSTWCPKFKENK